MNDTGRLSSSLTILQKVNHPGELTYVLEEMRTFFNLRHMAFLVVRGGPTSKQFPYYCTTYPRSWSETYVAGNFFEIDPVVDILRWSRLPVDWSALESERSSRFFKDARESDVGSNGITMPLRGPSGERCLLSVSSDQSRSEWTMLKTTCMHELSIISHLLHDKVFSTLAHSSLRSSPALSPRERQCLEQVAVGFIPKQIAAKLSISESSVRLYLRGARRKLDAKTSHQAVARASFLEMIKV